MRSLAFALFATLAFTGSPALAGEEVYELKAGQAKAAVGAKGKTSLTITGKNGWKVNEEAPMFLRLKPATGVSVEKDRLTKEDLAHLSKDKAQFDVAFTAKEPGKHTIDANAKFVMCQDKACQMVSKDVTLAIEASPAKK